MMLLTGNLIQRYSSKRLILVGGILMQFCIPLLLLAPSFTLLATFFFVFGGSTGMMDIAMNTQAARIENIYQRPIMSSFHAVFSLGTLLGGGLTSLLLSLGWTPLEHAGMIAIILLLLIIGTRSFGYDVDDRRGSSYGLERDLCPKPTGSVTQSVGCGLHRFRTDYDVGTFHRGQAGLSLGTETHAALFMRTRSLGPIDRTIF